MATKTKAEFIEQTLDNLGVLEAGQVPDTEDYQAVENLVTTVFEQLSGEGVITISDEEEIPAEIFLPLAVIMAEKCAVKFGRASDENAIMQAKADIYKVVYGRPTREVLSVDYF